MNLSRWLSGKTRSDSRVGRRAGGRASAGRKPACEALDARQLLSTVATTPAARLD
jgi:hypothetical protein